MKRLTSYIKIGKFSFKGVVNLRIEKSWEMLTSICEITIPRKLSFQGNDIATGDNPLLKKGDKVLIQLGYDSENETEFIGYIRDIKVATPIVITCEDSAFLLKQSAKTISFEKTTLKELLAKILPSGMEHEALDINLGQFRLQNATAAKVLEELKNEYNLVSFFKGEKLFVGFAYPPSRTIKTLKFQFGRNVINDDLDYRKEDEVKITVKAISMLPNNQKIEITEGDSDGDIRTYHYYDLQESDLRKMAKEEISQLRKSGWQGNFLAFGQPFLQHGDVVELIDKKLDRRGSYLVKRTVVTFGTGGYRREIHLDRKY